MAKKKTIEFDVFKRTEAAPSDQPDPVRPVGIGLKASEWARLEVIADELGVTRHTLSLWILRDFLTRWDSGWRPETEAKRVLRL